MKLYVADRITGTFIEEVPSIAAGKRIINEYEKEDRNDGTYQPNFYDVVNEDHNSVIVKSMEE